MSASRLLALLAVSVSAACGTSGTLPIAPTEYTLVQAADSIPLAYQRLVKVGDVLLSLTAVPEDSRCPLGVTCVWPGDAVAAITAFSDCAGSPCDQATARLALHTHLEPRAGEALGLRVRLLALLPEPVYGAASDPSRFVAWVRVTR